MAKCSIFKDIYSKDEPHHVGVDVLLDHIKSGRWAAKIHQIRLETESERRADLKRHLPSICFAGTFEKRYDNNIIKHSGFVILDFDHVENLPQLKEMICTDPFTYACFISPSGDGLKVLVKIPPDKDKHRDYYRGLMGKYKTLDPTSINLSRVCYASYDPELYINKDSKVFDKTIKEVLPETKSEAQETNYKILQVAADMVRLAPDGEKHHALIRASRLMGGYISAGAVEEHEAVRMLEIEINKRSPLDFKSAQKSISDGIEYGKKEPIYKENEKQVTEKIKKEPIIIEGEPARDVVYLDDVWDNVIYSFHNGTSRGETTHINSLDQAYRMARKEITVVHGYNNHGKSAFVMHLALLKSYFDGHKWAVFSPENYPAHEFYKDLIHSYIGKSTERHHHNQMSEEELKKGGDFVKDHFFFMYPEDHEPTPDYINQRFREMIIKHNIDGCIIDPYNQLDTDVGKAGGKEHLYLSKFLSMEKKFAVDNDVFFFIITHPRGDGELVNKNYKLPKVYSLSGGAMWGNKADNVLCIHRPNFSEWTDKSVIFESQKIKKQKLNGIPMEVNLLFDRETNRYYQEDGFHPLQSITPTTHTDDEVPF